MDEFLSLWSGDFEQHLLNLDVRADDVAEQTAENPLGAFADSDTDASLSPITIVGPQDTEASPQVEPRSNLKAQPKTPPLPPWKKLRINQEGAPVSKAPPSAKAEPAVKAAPSKARPAQPPNPAAQKALEDYRAAEMALNSAARESLYGPFNHIYYSIEKRVAAEKDVGWRERGPRGASQPDVWKSQKWRTGAGRYANRGGKHREYFAQKYGKPRSSSSSTGNANTAAAQGVVLLA
jgi:hypothetical protein